MKTRFAFRGADLLVMGNRPAVAGEDMPAFDFGDCVVVDWPEGTELPEGVTAVGLRALYPAMDAQDFDAAGRAFQLLGWARTNRFCGACGGALRPHGHEVALQCETCGTVVYPRLNPAVIVLITRGDEALLSRSPHFAPGMYSCQAGFVGLGESLEDAVRREVREEVGVTLRDVAYVGSQPWPFPNSLMIGFTATWESGEVTPDPTEIEDARWFRRDALPALPGEISIARKLIDAWLALG